MCEKEPHEHGHTHEEVTHSHGEQEHTHGATVYTHEHTHDEGHHTHAHIKVKGMTCEHCAAMVTKALNSLPGISAVQVDLANGMVSYQSAQPIPPEDLERVIKAADYEIVTA
jgi:copper chaperone